MLERLFRRDKNSTEKLIASLSENMAHIYTQLPNSSKEHKDGHPNGVVKVSLIPVLDGDDNHFLSLNGQEKKDVLVEALISGDEHWLGFSVNGRRVRLIEQRGMVGVLNEEKFKEIWKTIDYRESEIGVILKAAAFVKKKFITE